MMQSKHTNRRLMAGLLSLVMLLALLPAMSVPAAAAGEFFTVSGTVNNGQSFKVEQEPMSETDPTRVATVPVMYVGKQQTINVTVGKAVTWSIALGEQPEGMTLTTTDTTWTLSGEAQQPETASFLLQATPKDGSESQEIWIYYYCFNEKDRPKVTTTSLPGGNVDAAYYASLDFEGAYSGWAEWEIVSGTGSLPDGLTLNYNLTLCEIMGTPTKTGTFTFKVQVTTISGTSEARQLSITIDPKMVKPALKGTVLPYAVAGQEYSYDLKQLITNTDDYYPKEISDWEHYTGEELPTGLSIDSGTGMLSGTVDAGVAPKKYWFTVSCNNGLPADNAKLELPVYQVPVINETGTEQPAAKAGEPFSWTPLTAGDKVSSASWSAEGLPAGLHCGRINGDIYGTPTEAGTFKVIFKRFIPDTALETTKEITLTIASDRRFGLSQLSGYSFPSATRTDGEYTQPAKKSVTVTGTGYSPVDVQVTLSGTNASAFTLGGDTTKTLKKSETLTFTVQPAADLDVGTYTAAVTVSDTANADNKATFVVSFEVSDKYVIPKVTNYGELPYAVAGQTYTYQFNASGTEPYTWQIKADSGSLPDGMTINESGLLTWHVPEGQRSQGTVYVTANPKASSDNIGDYQRCWIPVYQPVKIQLQTGGASYSGEKVDGDRIVLPEGYVDRNYDRDFKNQSLTGGYRLFISTDDTADRIFLEGALPDGMEFHTSGEYSNPGDGSSGYFIKTPEKAGTYDFTIVAQKYHEGTLVSEARQKVRLIIHEAFTVQEKYFASQGWEVGKYLSVDLSSVVSGGKKPYKFSTGSTLPAGLTLGADGILSGTPTEVKQGFTLGLTVEDANGAAAVTSSTSTVATISFDWIDLPPLEFDAPDTGATFIDSISVGLSEAYLAKIGADKGDTYNLYYRYKADGSNANWTAEEKLDSYSGKITLSLTEINDFLKSWTGTKLEDSATKTVTLFVKLAHAATGVAKVRNELVFTKVAAPTAPTASPGTAGGETTFFGSVDVMLSTTTSGSGIGIRYTTDGSDPKTSGTAKEFTGKFITLAADTTIKACCYATAGTETVYSDVAEYKYVKAAGVTVSGRVTSYNAGSAATVQLMQSGTEKYSATVSGTEGTFSIANVVPGKYDLVVTKAGHLKYTVRNVTVGEEGLDLTKHSNARISTIALLCGDINGDDSINTSDINEIYLANNYYKNATDKDANPVADLNGDGIINTSDINIIYESANYYKGIADCTVDY